MRNCSLGHRLASIFSIYLCYACSSESDETSSGDGGIDAGDAAAEISSASSDAVSSDTAASGSNASSASDATSSSPSPDDAGSASGSDAAQDAGPTSASSDAAPPASDAGDAGSSTTDASEPTAAGDAGCNLFAQSSQVSLQNATATFSQTSFGGNPVSEAIDGDDSTNTGWAIYEGSDSDDPETPNKTNPQTAVFESEVDVGQAGSQLTFTLHHKHTLAGHSIGRFRLSVTSDARSKFADGLPAHGDVTAKWEVLSPSSATATNGVDLTLLSDDSLLASGETPTETTYTVTASSPMAAITGFRIEVMADESLPDMGPGRYSNGNFVLTEFRVANADCAPAQ